jgi:hypothetical protein
MKPSSISILSILSILSVSISSGTALPPHITRQQSYQVSINSKEFERDILGVQDMEEMDYAALITTQIARSLIWDDLMKLIRNIEDLVGEMGFSPPAVRAEDLGLGGTLSRCHNT